jgi:CubicO group peptidase (beta-lactamase class C family)
MSVDTLLRNAIEKRIFPGGVVGFCSPTEQQFWAEGNLDYSGSSGKVTPHTIYDVASVTKTIPTACIVWKLVALGEISLYDRVQSFLPEWQGRYKDEVLVWHLLAQTVRYEDVPLSRLSTLPRTELIERILELKIEESPSSSYFYVNPSSILLTWIIERVTNRSLDSLAQEYLWRPAGMKETSFFPSLHRGKVAPTERDDRTGEYLQGVVHDESARVLSSAGNVVGSAGLFSSAHDLLAFLQCLLQNDGSIFSRETLEKMFTPTQLASGFSVGLGWELNAPWMGSRRENCFGKTGFTGCCIAVVPQTKRALVFLSNTVHPRRPSSREEINMLRSQIIQSLRTFSFSQN